jgi:hypothetical protein
MSSAATTYWGNPSPAKHGLQPLFRQLALSFAPGARCNSAIPLHGRFCLEPDIFPVVQNCHDHLCTRHATCKASFALKAPEAPLVSRDHRHVPRGPNAAVKRIPQCFALPLALWQTAGIACGNHGASMVPSPARPFGDSGDDEPSIVHGVFRTATTVGLETLISFCERSVSRKEIIPVVFRHQNEPLRLLLASDVIRDHPDCHEIPCEGADKFNRTVTSRDIPSLYAPVMPHPARGAESC